MRLATCGFEIGVDTAPSITSDTAFDATFVAAELGRFLQAALGFFKATQDFLATARCKERRRGRPS